jgi:hypothetical protein
VHAILPGGGEINAVSLLTRASESAEWTRSSMRLVGRRTYATEFEYQTTVSPLMDYYIEAVCRVDGENRVLSAPPEAPARFYAVTLM